MRLSRVGRKGATCLAVGLALLLLASTARAAELPPGFQDTEAIDGLEEPTSFRFATDGRIFVAEKDGEILVYHGLEDKTPTLFADLRKQVFDRGDRGILGLALDPNFPASPYVYVLYTFDHVLGEDPPGAYPHWGKPPQYVGDECPFTGPGVDDCPVSGRLVRLTAEGDHAAQKEGAPDEKVLVENWCQQDSSHSVGDLQFGPEGALFASGGEGASFVVPDYGQFGWPQLNQCGDAPGGPGDELEPPDAEGGSLRSQDVRTPEGPFGEDPTSLDGSLIRIDPTSGEAWPGNPMGGSSDKNAHKIIAFGFRNPFRFSINPATDKVFVDNVGNGTDEEIDRLPLAPERAYNSGWPCYEGLEPNPDFEFTGLKACESLYAEPGSTSQPFFYYDHAAGVTPEDSCPTFNGSAISGSAFNDSEAFPPEYDGAFFFSDSVRGCIYVMKADEDGEPDPLTTTPFLTETAPYPGVDIEMGPEGSLFYASLVGESETPGSGSIHRISFDPGAPQARLDADRISGKLDLVVHFDASGSTSDDGEPLEYKWDLDGDGSFETVGGVKQTKTFNSPSNRTISVKVTDPGNGKSSVAQLTVYPGDTPPSIDISEPSEALTWGVGQQIEFAGTATAEEGDGSQIPAEGLYWKSRLLHCPFGPETCHAHPLQVFPATESGTLIAPDHDYPSHIELALTATDARGLSATKTLKLEPRSVNLSIASKPPGIKLTAGLQTKVTPFSLTAIEGGTVGLQAPSTASVDGIAYAFSGWSDGGARVHSITADASGEYLASYAAPSGSVGGAESSRPFETPPQRPSALLSGHPPKTTRSRTARFAFSAKPATSSFRCKLDAGASKPCRSPRVYRGLLPGRHAFRVVAVGSDGAGDSETVVFKWKVLGGRSR